MEPYSGMFGSERFCVLRVFWCEKYSSTNSAEGQWLPSNGFRKIVLNIFYFLAGTCTRRSSLNSSHPFSTAREVANACVQCRAATEIYASLRSVCWTVRGQKKNVFFAFCKHRLRYSRGRAFFSLFKIGSPSDMAESRT